MGICFQKPHMVASLHGTASEAVSDWLWVTLIMRQRVVETFSSVPSLPVWSFLRLIYGGFLPPPHSPRQARGCGFPR